MILRSVTSRLVFFYCLLLVVLGSAFLAFTVLSFQHYTRETITSLLSIRAREVWNVSGGVLEQPDRLRDTIERRFAPESQDRFIRIRAGNTELYRSGDPTSAEFVEALADAAKDGSALPLRSRGEGYAGAASGGGPCTFGACCSCAESSRSYAFLRSGSPNTA